MEEEKPKGKRGALSTAEMQYIDSWADKKSLEDISTEIGKSIKTIRKYAYAKNLVVKEDAKFNTGDIYKEKRARDILRHRAYFPELKMQFTPEELKQFEDLWIKMYVQFNEDIQTTEDLQMKKYITLEIMKDRFGKQVLNCLLEIEKLQKQIDEEYALGTSRNKMEIRELSTLLERHQAQQIQLAKNQRETMSEQKDVESKLKASRDQRVKGHLDANENFMSALRLIHENPEVRDNIGRHIEIMRLAQEKEKEKLFSLHTYLDKSVDRLILNKDSIGENND